MEGHKGEVWADHRLGLQEEAFIPRTQHGIGKSAKASFLKQVATQTAYITPSLCKPIPVG